MARPEKQGIDYFPLDVLYYRDEKIRFITALFDLEGEAVINRLWCRIYEEYGYYMQWNDDIAILFTADLQSRSCNLDKVKQIVDEAVRRDLFSKDMLENYGILTSKRIQQQYFDVTARRRTIEIVEEYLLLDKKELNSNIVSNRVNVDNNSVNVDINSKNVNNGTQSKVKESKVKNSTADACRHYQNCIGMVNGKIAEEIMMYEGIMEPELVCEAINQAARQNAKWAYARAILERCKDNNILTLADFKASERKPAKKEKTAEELLRERGYI